jgi:hypothetical protein
VHRHLLLILAAVLVVLGCTIVLVLDVSHSAPNTKLAPGANQASFVRQGDALCRPLVKLLSHRVDRSQLLLVRTEVEEIASIKVPVADRATFNVLLGVLATYGDAFSQYVTRPTGSATALNRDAARADSLYNQVGLKSCSI